MARFIILATLIYSIALFQVFANDCEKEFNDVISTAISFEKSKTRLTETKNVNGLSKIFITQISSLNETHRDNIHTIEEIISIQEESHLRNIR